LAAISRNVLRNVVRFTYGPYRILISTLESILRLPLLSDMILDGPIVRADRDAALK